MNELIVGIDLGTTNSEVAIVQAGRVVVIAEENGEKIMPSVVGLSEQGEVLIGESAKNQYVLYPERTIKSIKRQMGQEIKVTMAGNEYTPQEISAMILKRLKGIAENYLKQPVLKAVITVPAYFSDAQRQATREAGEIAGLEVMRIINEPTAAALSYEAKQNVHKQVLVYDLGGGTFDVSVVSIQDQVVEVLASHGNNHLGGDDFDQKIIDHLVTHLQQVHKVDVRDSRTSLARLSRAAETAKIALSDQPFVLIEEEYLYEHQGLPIHLSLELSRDEYEQMIQEFVEETLAVVHLTMQSANLSVADIDEVLLVGGSTRTPLVVQRLTEKFQQQPRGEVDPDLCVAAGAAIQAAIIAGQDTTAAAVLVDITPYTYGTSALGELDDQLYPYMYVPIIHKNTPLPVTKTEVFYTMYDHQEAVEVNVYQGEDADALNNIQIGKFLVEGLSKVPQGNQILLTLGLDLDGILKVSAKEKKTGLAKSIVINNAISRFEQAEMEQAKQRVRDIFGEAVAAVDLVNSAASTIEQNHSIVQAKALVEKAERMLEHAATEDKDDLVNLIETINEAMAHQDFVELKTAIEQLSDILYYLDS